VEKLDTITQRARPYPVDQLEFGTFSSEDLILLKPIAIIGLICLNLKNLI
jgi:hypothetical protein